MDIQCTADNKEYWCCKDDCGVTITTSNRDVLNKSWEHNHPNNKIEIEFMKVKNVMKDAGEQSKPLKRIYEDG